MYLRLERLGKKFEATEAVREFSLDVEGGEMLSLPGPSGCGKTIDQLSGGEQQRVALARALNVRPKVLLLDEPLSNLDAKLRVRMRGEIRRLQREFGITALYVTHDQEEALALSDRVAVMEGGRIVKADGRPTIRTAISSIYKERWEIELFFKTLKQNLKVKTFIGTSKNALRIQIWTAGLEMLKRHLRNKCC